ncbi:TIGR02450 family Trp-rich protein [Halopseudomonas laoshanensis]|uniref:TIGR02450 family Trp-rich protein n=1 Tax=Halopseudomonas laoshanensis TaxID=2268758 RepID=A0A7V7GQC5_9GAMM|nr:TIGR02450 family Trp-rich protein [Halopseudomonas laoshanensis]KAA0692387.1 TIGR02450 family Trp-rich protein [Halopseudomonas laoshanensis]
MNQINPHKLLLSKWTAVQPLQREKHFIVTDCQLDEQEEAVVSVDLQAVLTTRTQRLPWKLLKDSNQWQAGWR